ncbi:MAG: hypothetical protein JST16_00020, partial [Bdellovibrionales bacterium]|nr:hypothetical protein [Bdellovibrionales bacterium]
MTLRFKIGFGALLIALTYIVLALRRSSRTETTPHPTFASEVAPRSSSQARTSPSPTDSPSLPPRLPGELKQRPEAKLIASTPIPQISALWMNRSVQQNQLLRSASDLVIALGECLPLNLCGQRAPSNKPYAPDDLTPAHQTLNRALEILRVARDQGENIILSPDALLNALRGANAA